MKDAWADLGRPPRIAVAGLCVLALGLLAAGCQKRPEPKRDDTAADTPVSASPAEPQATARPLLAVDRGELLAAAAAAADHVAAGIPLPDSNLELTNRTFELRLPFGCSDGISGSWGQWKVDPATQVLRVTIRSQRLKNVQIIQDMASGMSYDAAEGFWIERPWTRSEQCPSGPGSAAANGQPVAVPAAEPVHTLMLVQYFSPDAPRTLQRGSRPYTFTVKLPADRPAAIAGYRIKLVGRISGFADGQPIQCVITAPIDPPTCAVAVEFDKLVLEDASTGQSLTEWTN